MHATGLLSKYKMKKIRYLILIVLLIAATYIWSSLFAQDDSNLLEVHFFDVGQGDSIFMECCLSTYRV